MELKMYSFQDQKAGIFYPPIYKPTYAEAEREFSNIVNYKGSTMNNNPEDFHMYYIGTYDNNTGKVEPVEPPQHLIAAHQLVKRDPPKTLDQ